MSGSTRSLEASERPLWKQALDPPPCCLSLYPPRLLQATPRTVLVSSKVASPGISPQFRLAVVSSLSEDCLWKPPRAAWALLLACCKQTSSPALRNRQVLRAADVARSPRSKWLAGCRCHLKPSLVLPLPFPSFSLCNYHTEQKLHLSYIHTLSSHTL